VLNQIDALLTLTGFSSAADRGGLHRVSLSSQSQSFTNLHADHRLGTLLAIRAGRRPGGSVRNIQGVNVPYRSVNPATGEVLKTFPDHTDEQMWNALATADKAFRAWAARPFSERSKIIGRSAQLLLEQKEELARLATLEMGKRIAESRGEVELSASILQYFSDKAETFLAPKKLDSGAGDARLEYSPFGVLLSIQPWNYPYYQLARFAGPHLMSGNVVLVKHAPGVPQCALAFEKVLREAGMPEGIYTNVFLSNDQAGALIDDPRVKGIALTGSERAGEALASRAGKNLKKSTMELGGSDAFVVLDDADLDHTVKMAILGRFGNNGQTCIGAKRFIVVKSMWDKFLPRFIAAAKKLKLGDPLDETVTLGPVSSDAALQLILRQIQEATSHGAQIALGGGRAGEVGAFLEPTILTNVTSDNPAYRQEFFGPAALVFPAKDEEEAIAIANDSPFGLGGSVYSSNIERAKRVASRMETGMVFINYPDVSLPELPFGGVKRSGYGKELSNLGIEEFVNRKLIFVPTGV
jgi:succinate-semialdehyde dehydrogenase/glutarate-semialdehyde dehydrogenase